MLGGLTDAQLSQRGCFKLQGSFPPPNEPGKIGHPAGGGRGELLLASGDVPTFPVSQPQDAVLLRVEPKVLSFRVQRLGNDPTEPGEEVLIAPGTPLQLGSSERPSTPGWAGRPRRSSRVGLKSTRPTGAATVRLSGIPGPARSQGTRCVAS